MSRLALGPADLAEGGLRGVALPDGRLVVVARDRGAFHALEDVCNHAGCLLSQGRVEAGRVVCPCHEAAFDLRTGAVDEPDFCADQRAYRVVVEGASLFLEEP